MDIWDRLRAVTVLAQDEEDLPDFLAERIFTLVELSRNCKDMRCEINDLTEKVSQYDIPQEYVNVNDREHMQAILNGGRDPLIQNGNPGGFAPLTNAH